MNRPDVSIVILTYNRSDLIDKRLAELNQLPLKYHKAEVFVFDNASTDGTPLILATSQNNFKNRGNTLWLGRTKSNLGFAPGFNAAVSWSVGETIILLSNDVKVFGDFISPVEAQLAATPDAIIAHQVISQPSGWNVFDGQFFSYPSGYFLAMHKGTWDRLGGFDEDYYPHDYEDVDLGFRAMQSAIPLIEISDLPIEHGVAQTIGFTPERYEQTVKMRALFAKKHGLENEPERP